MLLESFAYIDDLSDELKIEMILKRNLLTYSCVIF